MAQPCLHARRAAPDHPHTGTPTAHPARPPPELVHGLHHVGQVVQREFGHAGGHHLIRQHSQQRLVLVPQVAQRAQLRGGGAHAVAHTKGARHRECVAALRVLGQG